jgi:hypothetical protein
VGDYATVTDLGLDQAQRTFERIIGNFVLDFRDRPHETES